MSDGNGGRVTPGGAGRGSGPGGSDLDTRRAARGAPRSTSGVPSDVGVLGGGRMGAGIAHAFLLAGSRVTVVERDADAAAASSRRVLESVEASVARGTADEDAGVIGARFATSTDVNDFARCGLVVEAVPEDLELKIDALTRVEAVIASDAALASNTSSISIDQLAALLERPSQFLGMHFFNPVPASTLVEIVRGDATDGTLVAEAREWVAAIGKTPIVVTDAPGFASSRLGVALGLEAIRMLEDGVASAEDIDAAMTLGYRHPVGPLRLTDMVGLDVRLGIAEYLSDTLGERFAPPALLRRMVAEGKLGRKTGEGFYLWDAP
jgi:3-hydroxybutyryl-CoA dehydrogenase